MNKIHRTKPSYSVTVTHGLMMVEWNEVHLRVQIQGNFLQCYTFSQPCLQGKHGFFF